MQLHEPAFSQLGRTAVIYLDNNATTRPAPEVVQTMLRVLEHDYANPSSMHRAGQ